MEDYKAIFRECPDGILLVDEERKILAMNPALERLTGWRAEEVVGKRECQILFSCCDMEGERISEANCPGLRAIQGERSTPYVELALRSREGKKIVVAASYNPIAFDGRTCAISAMKEITPKKEMEEVLKAQALTDSLTGLANLRHFLQRLNEEMERAKRYLHPLSLILIDIDHFKEYNDQNGHPQGNLVLTRLAQLFLENSRKVNLVARYGGEEFAILLPETGKRTAIQAAVRLRRVIQRAYFPNQEAQPLGTLTICLGVASFPMDADEGESLIEAADRALYRAKKRGRNRVCWPTLCGPDREFHLSNGENDSSKILTEASQTPVYLHDHGIPNRF